MEKITQITTLGQMVPAAKRKPGVGAGLRMDTHAWVGGKPKNHAT
jgi:hypothetical protein